MSYFVISVVKTYINYILFLRKESLSNHIDKMIEIFVRIYVTGLKLNETNCIFALK